MNAQITLLGTLLIAVLATATSCNGDGGDAASAEATDGGGLLDDAGSLSGLEVLNPSCGGGVGAETDSCDDCVTRNCASQFEACFGPGYATELGGICASYGDCIMACDCGDPDCFGSCTGDLEAGGNDVCLDCVRNLARCELESCETECQSDDTPDAGRSDAGSG